MPCLQVGFLAKEVHERTARLRNTASVPFGEPDHQGRGRSPVEQASFNVHVHWRVAEKTRRPNARPLSQHKGDTQGINGAHCITRSVSSKQHLMCRLVPRERIRADDVCRLVLPDDEVSSREGAADGKHGRERQAKGVRQFLHAGGFPLVSKRCEDRFSDRILLQAQSRSAQPFYDAVSSLPLVLLHAIPFHSNPLPLASNAG
jgi:hypothetical protein